jgi:hypothetical protein
MKQKQGKFINTTVFWAACTFIATLLMQAGCQLISVLGTPTSAESKAEAEYNLAAEKNSKILVLVDQPSSLACHPNLRYFLTDTAIKTFEMKAKFGEELFISYDALAEFRSNTPDFSLMPPEQVGSALNSDFVLLIVVNNCRLLQIGDTGYISGTLDVQAQLIKVQGGVKVWPSYETAKTIRVGFESEKRDQEAAALRLAVAGAHCVTRYLYNCPKNQFKISDEITDVGWEKLK